MTANGDEASFPLDAFGPMMLSEDGPAQLSASPCSTRRALTRYAGSPTAAVAAGMGRRSRARRESSRGLRGLALGLVALVR
jgi:hypothetical protein